ncbi:MAG TPA: ABC transporter ATP-binding protein [Chitinophagaceae bacterium]|nr:ABC transporter ATP-binding protein [Chitinophagaceae bacterium]
MSGSKQKKFLDVSLLKRIFSYALPYKKQFIISVVLAVLLALIAPARPYLIQVTVDKYITNELVRMVVYITLLQIGLLLIQSFFRFGLTYWSKWLGQAIIKDMRKETYNKILGLNLRFFDRKPIGTLTTRTINDIEAINNIFANGIISIVADILMILAILTIMLVTDWRLTLIAISPFPILIIATYLFKESVSKSFFRVRNAISSLNAFVQEHLSGMFIVQAFSSEKREHEKFNNINTKLRDANVKAVFAYAVFFPVVEIVSAMALGLLVWYGSRQVLFEAGSIGIIIGFVLYINMLFRPLRSLADKFNTLQMGMVAAERVFKILDNKDEMPDNGTQAPKEIEGDIVFDKVWFAYKREEYVLKDISFHLKPGETMAIVGATGSGKTTMISILNRLYEIQKGQILIDGMEQRDYTLDSLRSHMGVVLQDVFLFSGSVLENITLRNPNISKARVIETTKMIGMHDFIMQLPGNYDFNVMERGGMLSLGQRQLISFIRALLYNPSILILDEATSSIDTESEELIQDATDKLIHNRTAIVIAHRLSTISKADKILVMNKGEIIEAGDHKSLLDQKGAYYHLHEMQFKTRAGV